MRARPAPAGGPARWAPVVLMILSFSLACRLTTDPSFERLASSPALGRLLGDARHGLGGGFSEQADRYFHRGVGHGRREARMGILQRLADEVAPRRPEHLHGGEIAEIMPWLRFTTRMDPGNVEAYLGAAFWAAQMGGHPQDALGILAEAQRENPYDYRVPMQRGMVLMQAGKTPGAEAAFDFALAKMGRTAAVGERQKRIDREALLAYRGLLHECAGRPEEALRCYREILRQRPESGVAATARAIGEGRRSGADARRALLQIMARKVTPDEHCRHDDRDGGAARAP